MQLGPVGSVTLPRTTASLTRLSTSKIRWRSSCLVSTLRSYTMFPYNPMQNWPLPSPDLSPLHFHLWRYMKRTMYERKVDTRDELLKRIS